MGERRLQKLENLRVRENVHTNLKPLDYDQMGMFIAQVGRLRLIDADTLAHLFATYVEARFASKIVRVGAIVEPRLVTIAQVEIDVATGLATVDVLSAIDPSRLRRVNKTQGCLIYRKHEVSQFDERELRVEIRDPEVISFLKKHVINGVCAERRQYDLGLSILG